MISLGVIGKYSSAKSWLSAFVRDLVANALHSGVNREFMVPAKRRNILGGVVGSQGLAKVKS